MFLSEYLLPLILISAALGIISFVSYPGFSDRLVRFASAMLVIYVALAPFLWFVKDISKTDFDGIFEDIKNETFVEDGTYIKVAEEAFKEGICKLLITKYGIKAENIRIYVFGFDFENMRAESIKIVLSGRDAAQDARGAEAYLNTLSLGRVEVNIEF